MSSSTEEEEEYKQQANSLKEQGNEAFQAGNTQLAISYFTQAIEIDPDNHVIYSNRSAAYMKVDSISKALHDAEKCVELAPNWVKGYNRLGVAQQSLKRFTAAIDTFKKGIELEPNNTALWNALKLCQDAYDLDRKQRYREAEVERAAEERKLKQREETKNEVFRNKQLDNEKKDDDDLLSGFFTEVGGKKEEEEKPKPKPKPKPKVEAASENPEDDMLAMFFDEVTKKDPTTKPETLKGNGTGSAEDGKEAGEEEAQASALTEKYAKQDLGSSKAQMERILSKHYQWKNLNPFVVFDLDIDATEEDIKFRYKKLSLKVHPDRLRDVENSRDAFEQVKEAYEKLMDADQRKTTIMHVENVTSELKKERKRLLNAGKRENELPEFEVERSRLLMKHFADIEQMRRRSETNRRVYSAREKMQETEEEVKMQKFEEFEKDWSEENRREKRMGNWRDFQDDPVAKKVRATNYKEESRTDKKHGKVELETWKKSWK